MILIHKFVTAGLLLVALALFIASVDSRSIDNLRAKKRDVESQGHILLYKRQADEAKSKAPEKHHRGQKTTTTSAPKAANDEDASDKAPAKKRKKAEKAKKLMDDVADVDKTTTKKPKGKQSASSSTVKPKSSKSGKGSTKKPAKKGGKEKDEDSKDEKSKDKKSKDKKSKGKKSKDEKSKDEESEDEEEDEEEESSDDKGKTKKAAAKKAKTEQKLKLANERLLQNQEVVAIEHMLAGVYDWMKVLKQTEGKTFNKKAAGELFEKVNNELAGLLSEQNKPKKLIAYYKQMKIK